MKPTVHRSIQNSEVRSTKITHLTNRSQFRSKCCLTFYKQSSLKTLICIIYKNHSHSQHWSSSTSCSRRVSSADRVVDSARCWEPRACEAPQSRPGSTGKESWFGNKTTDGNPFEFMFRSRVKYPKSVCLWSTVREFHRKPTINYCYQIMIPICSRSDKLRIFNWKKYRKTTHLRNVISMNSSFNTKSSNQIQGCLRSLSNPPRKNLQIKYKPSTMYTEIQVK